VNDGPSFTRLVRTAIGAAAEALGADGRLWLFGGAAVLDVPGTRVMTLALPKIPPIYESHRINLEAVQATKLDWSMLCPGPMIDAPDGSPQKICASRGSMASRAPRFHVFPARLALSLAFKQKIPEMTISTRTRRKSSSTTWLRAVALAKTRRCCIAHRSQTAQTFYAWLVSRMMRPFFQSRSSSLFARSRLSRRGDKFEIDET